MEPGYRRRAGSPAPPRASCRAPPLPGLPRWHRSAAPASASAASRWRGRRQKSCRPPLRWAAAKILPAPVALGGEPLISYQRSSVMTALYLLERAENSSKISKPRCDPPLAANIANAQLVEIALRRAAKRQVRARTLAARLRLGLALEDFVDDPLRRVDRIDVAED